jgi:hypothetical protein
MRTTIPMVRPEGERGKDSGQTLSRRVRASMRMLAACAVFAGLVGIQTVAGQAPPAATPAPVQAHKPLAHKAQAHKRVSAVKTQVAPAALVPAAVTTPVPEIPKWPVNEKPDAAAVTWDSQGLRISAANSSLQQILKDVSTETGAKVEGMGADVRIFGAYGPGRARDVLSQLLEGSGYNVMMIGDQGQGTPRQIILSARASGPEPAGGSPAPVAEEDADVDEQPQQPEQRQPGTPPFRPGFAPRTPQQTMQDRQQQQQQGQPQPQPGNPPNPPNQ